MESPTSRRHRSLPLVATGSGRAGDQASLSEIGEFGFLERLRRLRIPRRGVELGIGDDCAVVRAGRRPLLLTTDALVENVHFRWAWDTPAGLGQRAFAVNASDIAAMGGAPRFALLSIVAPRTARIARLEGIVRGFVAAARESGCALVGGNLSAGPHWMISVTLVGEPFGTPLRRSGARAGDHVYVSGVLGAAAFGREILFRRRRGSPRQTLAFRRPRARLDVGEMLARTRSASAAIDLSDGLASDLGHVCRASRVGALIDPEKLPFAPALLRLAKDERLALALGGGEDYELLFTIPPGRVRGLEESARGRSLAVTNIGRITRGRGIRLAGASRPSSAVFAGGFDHFRR
jgi:thiamine-monophosphate kinase